MCGEDVSFCLDAIEEGTTAEDLREFAKEKFGQNNGDAPEQEDE